MRRRQTARRLDLAPPLLAPAPADGYSQAGSLAQLLAAQAEAEGEEQEEREDTAAGSGQVQIADSEEAEAAAEAAEAAEAAVAAAEAAAALPASAGPVGVTQVVAPDSATGGYPLPGAPGSAADALPPVAEEEPTGSAPALDEQLAASRGAAAQQAATEAQLPQVDGHSDEEEAEAEAEGAAVSGAEQAPPRMELQPSNNSSGALQLPPGMRFGVRRGAVRCGRGCCQAANVCASLLPLRNI